MVATIVFWLQYFFSRSERWIHTGRAKVLSGIYVLNKKMHGDMASALMRTFTARGVASLGSFVLIVILGRLYGAQGVGIFALAQSLIVAVSIFGRWGMNSALIRFVGRDNDSPKVQAYLRYACLKAGLISTVGMVVVYLLRDVFTRLFHAPDLSAMITGIALAMPPFVLAYIFSGFMAAIRKPATACLMQNGAVSFVAAALVLLLRTVVPGAGFIVIGIAYAIAAWVICIWGFCGVWRWLRHHNTGKVAIDADDVSAFKHSSSAFFATSVASFLLGVVGIWVAGYWLPTASVGLFKAGQQLSMLIAVILTVINLIVPTRFSYCFHHGDMRGLERLARRSALGGLVLGTLPLVVCLVAPRWILSLVGHDFSGAAVLLQILALGQVLNLGCGSVGHVLNMTGHEGVSSRIAWFSNIIGLTIVAAGTPFVGIIAVAIGVATGLSLRKLIGVFFVWRILGIWMPPVPNVLHYLGVKPLKPVLHNPASRVGFSDPGR